MAINERSELKQGRGALVPTTRNSNLLKCRHRDVRKDLKDEPKHSAIQCQQNFVRLT